MSLYSVTMVSNPSPPDGNPLVNVFTYDVNDLLPSSEAALALANEFVGTVVNGATGLKDLFGVGISVAAEVVVKAPQVPSVLAILTPNVGGTRAGQLMPRFATLSFKTPRQRGDMHAGFKRLGWPSESDIVGSNVVAGYTGIVTTCAALMSQNLDFTISSGDYTATPVIVQRVAYSPSPGRTAYRLPGPGDPYVSYPATQWSFVRVTTQNSRKS